MSSSSFDRAMAGPSKDDSDAKKDDGDAKKDDSDGDGWVSSRVVALAALRQPLVALPRCCCL